MSESELASSDQSPPSSTSSPTIQIVSKSFSERLMGKFFDATQFDFVYEQSGLWSPPVRRTVFLASPGNICSQDEMVRKLKKAKKTWKRPMLCFFNINNSVIKQLESFGALEVDHGSYCIKFICQPSLMG
ncbi:unnamed protein product [Sphenostylis stenocarpa]|uniref:Uncharacterized protein n=1 Tax=Sphenostylis stenocarpa TaxID=92480 RepID=A0AA86W5N4_9FABA|nr:unnamed protein product [Sphenostylis stenocarpa]